MIIKILQNNFSYVVYENNSNDETYTSIISINWRETSAKLFDKNNKLLLTIKNEFNPFFSWKFSYEVNLFIPNSKILYIKPVKIFKGHWRMQFDNYIYDYYIHRNHNKSLFKNDIQVAKFGKKKFHLFNKDTLFIEANNDENKLMLLSFLIAFDMGSNNQGSMVTFDIGNIGPEERKYNTEWIPK